MALVKHGSRHLIGEAGAQHNGTYDRKYRSGDTCQFEGIYKCAGCGKEITLAKGKTFPPQNHHQHSLLSGAIEWQLLVFAQ
ncbi:TPA: protein L [Klebsiella pneumoniae]|uniref:protein L n=1 Tax=Klebsiella TaxID=570 RepID=UPI0009382FF2|nr:MULTISPECIES: protein L [Klebsiella]APP18161.1 protein L [Klebsiella pneumoniae]OVU28024.1 protein L [Klebsiella michiganensis]PXM32574.1 protein L [Klebsiella variicola]RIV04104.1 protein L [Klebsiella pneumoniae]HBS7392794.1 protein L [Klebsiella pneumoniae]